MGVKLKFCWIFLFFILFQCKSQTISNNSYTKYDYTLAFKTIVLYGCINEKTNEEFGELLNRYQVTNSREVAILFHAIVNQADSIGRNYSKKITPYTYYGDLKGKVPLFGKCVEFAFSRKIDSIATDSYYKTKE